MSTRIATPFLRPTGPLPPQSPEFEGLLARIAEGAAERDRERIHPHAALNLVRQARIGALRVPITDGGGGLTFRELFAVAIRLGGADSNVAHILRNHFVFVERFALSPEDDQQRHWQRAVVDGAIFGLANTELERVQSGRDSATILTRENSGYRLNGTKYYSTGCLYADYIILRAKGPDGAQASAIIPATRDGVTLVDDWDGAGQRLTGTGTTRLENVRVEAREVIFDKPGAGYGLPYSSTLPQLFLTAVNAGIIRSVLSDAKGLIHRRGRAFYHAPAEKPVEDPILQQVIGQIASNAFAAEATVLAAADGQDILSATRARGHADPGEAGRAALLAAKAKVVVDDLALRSATALYDIGGASSTKKTYNFDRHWRNARTLASHNPSLYKARAIGDHEVNGTPLPAAGFF